MTKKEYNICGNNSWRHVCVLGPLPVVSLISLLYLCETLWIEKSCGLYTYVYGEEDVDDH